jgi:hypothetical protein
MFHQLENARVVKSAAAAIALALTATMATAQTSASRWQAWVGCWQVAESGAPQRLCVTPSSTPSAVSILTIDSGRVVSRHEVDASGTRKVVERDGCAGWEQANWSKDGLRIFLESEVSCGTGLKRSSTGIMSMTSGGEWVDAQTLKVAESEMVRTTRYTPVKDTAGLPSEVVGVVAASRRLDARTAAMAAGGRISAEDIVEAASTVDTTVVQAWLMERRQEFNVDGKTLVALADAGVPGSVTDVLVALANPDLFRLYREEMSAPSLSRADSARIASDYLRDRDFDCAAYGYSPFGWGPSRSCYRYGMFYDSYRYRGAYGYGYDAYYPSYYGYYTRPVVIVRGNDTEHGVAVNGRGYTRPSSSSSSSGSSSRDEGSRSSGSSASSGSTSSGSASSGSSSSSGSSGSSSSSGSSGRTAKSRPPAE